MFDFLLPYRRALVTGPQRSGTGICARMVAHDLGWEYIDEDDIGIRNLGKAREIFQSRFEFVMQAPALSRFCHELSAEYFPLPIVWMRRPLHEIIASQERINWDGEAIEKMVYFNACGPVAKVKYDFWENVQRRLTPTAYEIHYASLSGHPLWVGKEERKKWGARQWAR